MAITILFSVLTVAALMLRALDSINGHIASPNSESGGFCYDDPTCGPDTWTGECNLGKGQQSPINLISGGMSTAAVLSLNNGYYEDIQAFSMTNNGHSVEVRPEYGAGISCDPNSIRRPIIHNDFLADDYVFEQMHFHWGPNDESGSEHTVNGQRFSMEAHFVHYNAKFPNFAAAASSGSPLAIEVLGVFLQAADVPDNENIGPIVENLKYIQESSNKTMGMNLRLQTLLPASRVYGKAFYYSGSLTTPPCAEIVQWTVFATPLYISRAQMAEFRKLHDSHNNLLVGNYRPIQTLKSSPKLFEIRLNESD